MIPAGAALVKNTSVVIIQTKMLKDKSSLDKALFVVILAAFLGGGTAVYVKIGLKDIPPFTYTFIRFSLALIFFIPLLVKTKFKINKESIPVFAVSLLSSINIILFSFGIRLTSASVGQLIYAAVPMLAAIISFYLLKEKITWKKLFGILIGLVGMCIIIVIPLLSKSTTIKGNLLGNLLIFIGAVSYTFYTVLSKKIQTKFSPIYITAIFFITTMVISLFFAFFEISKMKNLSVLFTRSSLFSLFYISFFASTIAYLLHQYAIKFGSPLIASMGFYLNPITTVVWAFFILGEVINRQFIIGGLLALFGAWLVSSKK